MNFLITGGAGFIGSSAARYFAKKGHRIIVLDNLLSGYYENIEDLVHEKKMKFYQGSIADRPILKKIFSENKIDICINYAALVSVVESTENPQLTEEINVLGLIKLLEFCGKSKIKAFIHASSAAVYGDGEVLPKEESMMLFPKSPYAISKLSGEYYNNYFASIYGFKAINFRFFNVFGESQDPSSPYAAAIPIFISRALKNQEIAIYGDGEQTRDFVYVEDLISAKEFVLNNLQKVNPDQNTFNVGYGDFISIKELVFSIIDSLGSSSEVVYKDTRPGEIKFSYASVDRLKQMGWSGKVGFKAGLERTINWFKTRYE